MAKTEDYTANSGLRVKALICEISFRESCHLMAQSPLVIDPVFLPKGLHDVGQEKMVAGLQEQVDSVDPESHSYTLLVYGLCNNGIVGLRATKTPLVVPRAHDCITFFFGAKEKYQEYFEAHPGTYFQTTGWQERNVVNPDQELPVQGGADASRVGDSVMTRLGLNMSYQEYAEKYGEENARYIVEVTGNWTENYSRHTYLSMGVADHLGYQARVKEDVESRGWEYDERQGSLELLKDLFFGKWDEERFLVVPVGEQIAACHDTQIIDSR